MLIVATAKSKIFEKLTLFKTVFYTVLNIDNIENIKL